MTFKQIESGRSMVEMLGTLAIIGVLSIGGIAGYSYGMDKYRANETINDVNLRAMDLISQLSHGTTPTLDSWAKTGTAGYPISLSADETTTNHYIKVEKVPFRVCDIISDTMPESVVIEVNNDTEQCADGENTMYFAYTEVEKGIEEKEGLLAWASCTENSDCGGECYVCNDNRCDNTIKMGEPCQDGSGTCVWGQCIIGTTCETNADCTEPKHYCAGEYGNGCNPSTSNCTPFNYMTRKITVDGKTETILVSRDSMSWWHAKAACESQNKSLISIDEIVVGWDEEAFDEDRRIGEYSLTKFGQALYNELGDIFLWTSDWYWYSADTSYCIDEINGYQAYGVLFHDKTEGYPNISLVFLENREYGYFALNGEGYPTPAVCR